MLGPPLLIGDHVAYSCDSGAFLNGTVRWMGRVSALYGQQMVVGVELVGSITTTALFIHSVAMFCYSCR